MVRDNTNNHYIIVAADSARRLVDKMHNPLKGADLNEYDGRDNIGFGGAEKMADRALWMLDLLGLDVTELSFSEREDLIDELIRHWTYATAAMKKKVHTIGQPSQTFTFIDAQTAETQIREKIDERRRVSRNAALDAVRTLADDPLWQFLVFEIQDRKETNVVRDIVAELLAQDDLGVAMINQDGSLPDAQIVIAPLFTVLDHRGLDADALFMAGTQYLDIAEDDRPPLFIIASDPTTHHHVETLTCCDRISTEDIGFQYLSIDEARDAQWVEPYERSITHAAALVKSAEEQTKSFGRLKHKLDVLPKLWDTTNDLRRAMDDVRRDRMIEASGRPEWPDLPLSYREWTAPDQPGGNVRPKRGANRKWHQTKPAVYFKQYLQAWRGCFTLDDVKDRELYLAILNAMGEWADFDVKIGLLPRIGAPSHKVG